MGCEVTWDSAPAPGLEKRRERKTTGRNVQLFQERARGKKSIRTMSRKERVDPAGSCRKKADSMEKWQKVKCKASFFQYAVR